MTAPSLADVVAPTNGPMPLPADLSALLVTWIDAEDAADAVALRAAQEFHGVDFAQRPDAHREEATRLYGAAYVAREALATYARAHRMSILRATVNGAGGPL